MEVEVDKPKKKISTASDPDPGCSEEISHVLRVNVIFDAMTKVYTVKQKENRGEKKIVGNPQQSQSHRPFRPRGVYDEYCAPKETGEGFP